MKDNNNIYAKSQRAKYKPITFIGVLKFQPKYKIKFRATSL